MATPYASIFLSRVASTQDEARDRFTGTPLLVFAERQTRGRGRAGRRWQRAPRSLATSLAFTPPWPRDAWPRITLVAGLAARSLLGGDVGLKWPNDLVRTGPGQAEVKLGGLLAETAPDPTGGGEFLVIGLGVNLWWPGPPAGIGAVHGEDPGEEVAPVLAERWADSLLDRVAAGPEAWGRSEYVAVCATLGRSVSWEAALGDARPSEGEAVGVDADGSLIVVTDSGEVRLASGEVQTIREVTLAGPPSARWPEEESIKGDGA